MLVFIKPWENDDIINKIKLAEESNAIAVGVDIDACGLVTLSMHGKKVVPKTVEDLRKLKNSTKLPFIVKGIMTVEDALMAVEAGVDAIVISNHGGRVLDCTPGICEVIPSIANAVLIGRPFVTASFGGKTDGVKTYVENIKNELKSTMILTGCQSIRDIDSKVIYNY